MLKWLVDNWPSVLLLFAGIAAAIATYKASQQDQKQKDLIQELAENNIQLSNEIKNLAAINNQIADRVEKMTKQGNILGEQNAELITEVKSLTEQSKELISKVDATITRQDKENTKVGEFSTFIPGLKDKDTLTIKYGSYEVKCTVAEMPQKGIPYLFLDNINRIPLSFVDGKLMLTMKVLDYEGNLVADIVNNKWRRMAEKFNYDNSGFEIMDNQGNIVWSVDIVGHTLHIQGLLPAKGFWYIFGEDKTVFMPKKYDKLIEQYKAEGKDYDREFEFKRRTLKMRQLFEYNIPNYIGVRKK